MFAIEPKLLGGNVASGARESMLCSERRASVPTYKADARFIEECSELAGPEKSAKGDHGEKGAVC